MPLKRVRMPEKLEDKRMLEACEAEIPWLRELNVRGGVQSPTNYALFEFVADDLVFYDEQARRAWRSNRPGDTWGWDGFVKFRKYGGPNNYTVVASWENTSTFAVPRLGVTKHEGQWHIIAEYAEGQEHLWGELCRMMNTGTWQAHYLGLVPKWEDGRYPGFNGGEYDVRFPWNGSAPKLAPVFDVDPRDEPLTRFIALAEATFEPVTNIVKAGWKLNEGSYVFARPSYQFTSYEKFVFQFAMLLGGLGAIDRPTTEQLVASATFADGKADISGVSYDSGNHAAMMGLLEQGNQYYTPKKLAEWASFISQKVAEFQDIGSPPVLKAWLAKHVTPPKKLDESSALFSREASDFSLPLGLDPGTGKTVHYTGEASLITIAPSGKGKTQCHVLPTLTSYKGPVLVLDIKGECYEHTADWRRQNVGPVIRFNPVEPDGNARYNPLQLIDDDPDEIWESARFLAELLVVTRSVHDPSWESQGRDMLTLILAYVTSVYEPADRNMARVLDLVGSIGLEDMLAAVGDRESPFPSAMRRVAARFHQMLQAPKQFQGVLSGLTQHLQLWEGPKLERATTACDWHPDDFRKTPCPTVYLCIPPNAIESYASVLRVIIGQHVRRLMKVHEKGAAPILFLLDELPRLGRMEPIREALEVGRSYGIKLWMFAQYPEQFLQAYPGVGDGMMESCDVRMYMNPAAGTADKLARAFGKAENVLDNSRKDLLESADVVGPKHRDSIFALASNETPLVLRKKFFHEGATTGQT